MIPLLSVDDVKRAEQAAIDSGISESELMLRAGNQIADFLEVSAQDVGDALILCGPGKNGGDGIVIATRLLEFGWNVTVWCWERDGIASAPVDDNVAASIQWVSSTDELTATLRETDVVVDAIFGTGSRPELPDPIVEVFDLVRSEHERRYLEIWAIDLPSGVSADTGECSEHALYADITAMVGLPKIGAFKLPASSLTTKTLLFDIGLTAPADLAANVPRLISPTTARRFLPQRRTGLHKRGAGTLMIVGGAPHYYGAPRLTGEAALRSGAGLVSIAAPASIIGPIATAVPELTFVPLPVSEHSTAASRMASIVRENMSGVDALVIGSGLSTDAPVPEFLSQLLGFDQAARSGIGFGSHEEPDPVAPFAGRAVLDADALNWLSGRDGWWEVLKDAELVLTPHAGELARLLNVEREAIEANPWEHALEAAGKFGQVLVLKYAHTVIALPDGRLYVAGYAPVGLASAGTGDVLAGLIGAFLAQGLDTEQASVCGVGLGLGATEAAVATSGSIGFTASDIIREIPSMRERIVRARTPYA